MITRELFLSSFLLFKYIYTHNLQTTKVEILLRPKHNIQAKEVYCIRFNFDESVYIEDITWPRGDTSFIVLKVSLTSERSFISIYSY